MPCERLEGVVVDSPFVVERRHDRGQDVPEHPSILDEQFHVLACPDARSRGTARRDARLAHFVLVHGAWHGRWCFERLGAELEARGHEVTVPEMPCDEVGLTVRDYAALAPVDHEAVVVGHSMGGITIPFIPGRMTVFLGALVPVRGVFAGLDPEFTGTERDELGRSYWPTAEVAAAKLYPDLSPEEAAAAFGRLRPQAPVDVVYELPPGACASIVTMR